MNLISTVPLADVGVNLVVAVTAGSRSLPVSLSIKRPETVYSVPGLRFLYETVSTNVIGLASTVLRP